MCILMCKCSAVFVNSCLSFKNFWVKNAKMDFFEEIQRGLSVVFIELKLRLLKAYRIKFQKFAAHAHKDALINKTVIPT